MLRLGTACNMALFTGNKREAFSMAPRIHIHTTSGRYHTVNTYYRHPIVAENIASPYLAFWVGLRAAA